MTAYYKQTHARGSSARPSRGRSYGRPYPSRSRYPRKSNRGAHAGARIDIARFINKAPVAEAIIAFTPQHAFADFAIDESLKKNIAKKGYDTPTPIQDSAIPQILEGKDIVGIANTGTGKTGAFLIPLIHKVLRNKAERVLVVVPTRELALQIEEEFWGFADYLRIGAVSCVGGASIGKQIATLRRDPHFVIGTPGRLKDLMERRVLDLSRFRTVVLDEADRMLDMGFIADMRFLVSKMAQERHTLFFSATVSSEIESLVREFLRSPARISVKRGDTAQGVEQDIVRVVAGKNKIDVLHDLLMQPEFSKVLVFGRTKHGVEKLSKVLIQRGFKAEAIHGNKNQNRRQRALSLFKDSRVQILVATDVAARGIDVPDVSHVINYDIPTTYEDYVHRIGRTGRAGKRGKALTFVE
ncbi:MAG: DEAD/DEAH box helicase [Patescibacteria group bacterium]|nr:DEAD/DEAH box helicase [Patescibacteria group bacterium]